MRNRPLYTRRAVPMNTDYINDDFYGDDGDEDDDELLLGERSRYDPDSSPEDIPPYRRDDRIVSSRRERNYYDTMEDSDSDTVAAGERILESDSSSEE